MKFTAECLHPDHPLSTVPAYGTVGREQDDFPPAAWVPFLHPTDGVLWIARTPPQSWERGSGPLGGVIVSRGPFYSLLSPEFYDDGDPYDPGHRSYDCDEVKTWGRFRPYPAPVVTVPFKFRDDIDASFWRGKQVYLAWQDREMFMRAWKQATQGVMHNRSQGPLWPKFAPDLGADMAYGCSLMTPQTDHIAPFAKPLALLLREGELVFDQRPFSWVPQ